MLLPSGNPFKCHDEALYQKLIILPKHFDIFPLTGGCSKGLDAFRFCFKNYIHFHATAGHKLRELGAGTYYLLSFRCTLLECTVNVYTIYILGLALKRNTLNNPNSCCEIPGTIHSLVHLTYLQTWLITARGRRSCRLCMVNSYTH